MHRLSREPHVGAGCRPAGGAGEAGGSLKSGRLTGAVQLHDGGTAHLGGYCFPAMAARAQEGIDLTAEPATGSRNRTGACAVIWAFWEQDEPRKRGPPLGFASGPATGRLRPAPGARGSRLLKLLRAGHQKVTLTEDELRRIAVWIDCNAVFYGSYRPEVQAEELAGKAPPLPEVE